MTSSQKTYCAFCRTPKRLPQRQGMGPYGALGAFLFSFLLMWILFGQMSPKVLIIFVISSVAAEFIMRLRWRAAIICQECGFDPITYLQDKSKAVTKVKAKLALRDQGLNIFLKKPLHLPQISKERASFLENLEQQRSSVPVDKNGKSSRLLSRCL